MRLLAVFSLYLRLEPPSIVPCPPYTFQLLSPTPPFRWFSASVCDRGRRGPALRLEKQGALEFVQVDLHTSVGSCFADRADISSDGDKEGKWIS